MLIPFQQQQMLADSPNVSFFALLYLWRHSPGAGWAGITKWADHASDRGTPGTTFLRKLNRDFRTVLPPACIAKDYLSREDLQVCLDCACPRLPLATSSSAPRVRRGWQKWIHGQLTVWRFCSTAKPSTSSLDELRSYDSEAEAAPEFCCWYAISVSLV